MDARGEPATGDELRECLEQARDTFADLALALRMLGSGRLRPARSRTRSPASGGLRKGHE